MYHFNISGRPILALGHPFWLSARIWQSPTVTFTRWIAREIFFAIICHLTASRSHTLYLFLSHTLTLCLSIRVCVCLYVCVYLRVSVCPSLALSTPRRLRHFYTHRRHYPSSSSSYRLFFHNPLRLGYPSTWPAVCNLLCTSSGAPGSRSDRRAP